MLTRYEQETQIYFNEEEQHAEDYGEDLPEEDLISCENCGKVIKGYGRMSASEVLSIAQKKYGGCYCADCMTKSAK